MNTSSFQEVKTDEKEIEGDSIMSSAQTDSIVDEGEACIGRITLVSCATGSEAPGPPLGEFVAPRTQTQIDKGTSFT